LKLLLIFNPNAFSGRATRLLSRVQADLQKFCQLTVKLTDHSGHGCELVADTPLTDFDGVIAAGGDGTLFEVLNGLYQHERSERVPLGVIPIGTGNAFARDLGLMPGDWHQAIEIISSGVTRPMDVGQVVLSDRIYHFLNIIGMGFPVDAMRTAAKLKKIGSSAYTIAVILELLRLRSYPLELQLDGKQIQQDNIFVEISNTRYTGTSFLMAPEAELDDGFLDVTLLRKTPRLRLFQLFPSIYKGRHVEFEEISTFKAREIRISAPENARLVPDGEFQGKTPATITCLKKDLEIFSPGAD